MQKFLFNLREIGMNNLDFNVQQMLRNAETMANLGNASSQKNTTKFTARLLNANELIERANGQGKAIEKITGNKDSKQKYIVIQKGEEIIGITKCAVCGTHLWVFENYMLDGLGGEQYNKELYTLLPGVALENDIISFGKMWLSCEQYNEMLDGQGAETISFNKN